MTETEILFAAMSRDELDEAGKFLELFAPGISWEGGADVGFVYRTAGPRLALEALHLAWLREVAARFGGTPWYYPESLEHHPAKAVLQAALRLAELNPDRRLALPGGELPRILEGVA